MKKMLHMLHMLHGGKPSILVRESKGQHSFNVDTLGSLQDLFRSLLK